MLDRNGTELRIGDTVTLLARVVSEHRGLVTVSAARGGGETQHWLEPTQLILVARAPASGAV
jgi:hypothetical protein